MKTRNKFKLHLKYPFGNTSSNLNVFLSISAVFLCISGYSQTDSLYGYLDIAAKNNPTVLQRYYEYEAALQKIPQVGSLPDPELSAGVFLSPMEQVAGNQVADLRLMQMFPWFGVLKAGRDEMSLMAQAKYESFRDAKLQLYYDIQSTWNELNKIKQNIKISEKNIEILNTIENLSIIRFKTGADGSGSNSSNSGTPDPSVRNNSTGSSGMQSMGSNAGNAPGSVSSQSANSMQGGSMGSSSGSTGLSDVYRIQIEIGDLQNNIDLLKNQWNTLLAEFNSYLNRPPQTPVFLPDTLVADTFSIPVISILDSISTKNPMLGMLQYEQQSLDARKMMVTRMGYPMIGVGLNYSIISKSPMSTSSMNGKDMIMPMVTATLPIYRKKYRAMQSEADMMKSATAASYTATSNSLKTDYYQALQLYEDSQRRINLYAEQYDLASKTLGILLKGFANSNAGLTDILRVRQQTLDYEFKKIEAVADYNKSVAKLRRLGNSEIL